jgi:class 3 adenylate cyclase
MWAWFQGKASLVWSFHKKTLVLCFFWFLSISALAHSFLGASIHQALIHPLEFKVRSYLGKAPSLHPNLKIYAFDDATLKKFMTEDLEMNEWAGLLQKMAEAKPRMILVDKIFGTPRGNYDPNAVIQSLQSSKVPIIAAGFLHKDSLGFREPLHTDQLDIEYWARDRKLQADPAWLPVNPRFPYGPAQAVVPAFSSVGHVLYDNNGRYAPFERFAFSKVMPHLTTLAAKSVQINSEELTIDGIKLHPNNGQIAINFPDIPAIQNNVVSILSAILRYRDGVDFKSVIKEDQVVLILPAMFTGGSDTVASPLGDIPGGYIHVSTLNSILRQDWIRTWPDKSQWHFFAILLGLTAGLSLAPLTFTFSMISTVISVAALGVLGFAYFNHQLPWFWTSIAFLGSGIISQTMRNAVLERLNGQVRKALTGIIPEKCVDKVVKNPQLLDIQPSGQSVSIMFIDIVGFSITTQRLTPSQSFSQLRELLTSLTRIIHEHGGVVDKTLGDGILCFFGYDITGDKISNHADVAVQCAIAIQKHSFQDIVQAEGSGRAIFPLRIGINSASVFIGNIGSENRFDFTMIGDGVNFASRLEGACDPFRIMIGTSTKAQITQFASTDPAITKRFIRIKHHTELIEAWQIDAFYDQKNAIEKVEHIYWNFQKITIREDRIKIERNNTLTMNCELGTIQIHDFSRSGFGIIAPVFLARTVTIEVFLDSPDGELARQLTEAKILPMTLEVCWGRKSGDRYKHGVKIVSLNKPQKDLLYSKLKNLTQVSEPIERDQKPRGVL